MDLDIFYINSSLVQACDREPKVMTQRDGILLVEAASLEEAAGICALSDVPSVEVSCTPNVILNQYRSVVL